MIEKYKICKGCKFYEHIVTLSDGRKELYRTCRIKYPILSSTQQCPCLTCIVKSMCSSTCEAFFKYRDFLLYKEVKYEQA